MSSCKNQPSKSSSIIEVYLQMPDVSPLFILRGGQGHGSRHNCRRRLLFNRLFWHISGQVAIFGSRGLYQCFQRTIWNLNSGCLSQFLGSATVVVRNKHVFGYQRIDLNCGGAPGLRLEMVAVITRSTGDGVVLECSHNRKDNDQPYQKQGGEEHAPACNGSFPSEEFPEPVTYTPATGIASMLVTCLSAR